MRPLALSKIDHKSLYSQCVSQIQSAKDRATLVSITTKVVDAGKAFTASATAKQCHSVHPLAWTPNEKKLLRPLYDSRLASKKGIGRWAYDLIKSSAQHCPYCSFGEVYEVDHFLPKKAFLELNICPSNLVPICHPCNHIKLESKPEGSDKYLLHPYFDELPDVEWLFAELKFSGNGPSLHYRVSLDEHQFGELARRLKYHFSKLELDRRFKERAAQVLVELENDLTDHLDDLDPPKLMAHFKSEADRRFRNHGNTLEAAAYRAASNDLAYCSGQYRN